MKTVPGREAQVGRGGDEGRHLDLPGAGARGRGSGGHCGGAGGQGRKMILMVKPVEKWFVFYKQVDKTVLFLVIVILSGFPDD